MIATVSNLTIDLSRLEAIWLGYKDFNDNNGFRDLVILRLKPTLQYLTNPITGELEVHTVESPLIEQRCIDEESQQMTYKQWVSKWEHYKESMEA